MTAGKKWHHVLKDELAGTHGSFTTAGQTSSGNITGMKSSIVSTEQNTRRALIEETASMQPKERAELLREQEKYLEYHQRVKKDRAHAKNS